MDESGKKIYTTLDKTGKKIKFTFDEFDKGLTGTWLTKNVSNAVYGFDSLAKSSYQAAQKCTTFTDVLGAWKDMISTGWMATMQHIFGNLSDSINLFSAMCDKVSDNILGIFGKGGDIEQIFAKWESIGGQESLWSLILGESETPEGEKLYKDAYGLLDIITDIKDMISEAFWDVMKSFAEDYYDASEMVDWDSEDSMQFRLQFIAFRIRDFTDSVRDFILKVKEFFSTVPEGMNKSRWEMIKDTVKAVFHAISLAAQVIGGIFHFFSKIRQQLSPSIDAIADLFHSLVGSVIDTETGLRRGKGITTFFDKLAEFLKPITAVINKAITGVTAMLKSFIKWGKESGFFVKTWQTIKDTIKSVWNFISGIATPIVSFIGDIFHAIKDLFQNGFSKESINIFKDKIKLAFSSMWNGIKSAVKPATEKINTFFTRIWTVVKESLADYFGRKDTVGYKIVNWFIRAFENLKSGLDKIIPGASSSIGNFFKKIGQVITDLFSGNIDFLGAVKGIWQKVSEAITNFFKDGIGGIFGNIWNAIKGFFNNINDFTGGIGKTLGNIVSSIKDFYNNIDTVITGSSSVGETILAIIKIIGDFLGKLTAEQWIMLGGAAIAIFVIIKIAAFMKQAFAAIKNLRDIVMSNQVEQTVKPLQSVAGKILMIGAAIALIAVSVKMIGEMELADMIKGLVGVTVVLVAIGLFFKLTKDIFHGNEKKGIDAMSKGDVVKMVIGVIGLSIAIKKVINAVLPLAKYNEQELKLMGASLIVVCGVLAGVAAAVGKSKFDWKAGLGFALFAWSIGILMKNLELILKYRNAEGEIDWQALKMMAGSLLVIAILLGALGKAVGNNKGILYMAALVAGISIMIYALKQVADMKPEQLLNMGIVLVGILGGLLLFIKLFPKKGTLEATGLIQVAALAVGIYLLIKALMPVANMNYEQLGKMGTVLAGVILGLVGLIAAVNKLEGQMTASGDYNRGLKKSGLGAVILLALGIAAMILALKQVADIGEKGDWDGIFKMMTVYLAIVGGLVALIAVVNKTGSENRGLKKSGMFIGILAIALGIVAIIEVLKPLANMNEDQLTKMFIPFAIIMAGLYLVTKQFAKFTSLKQGTQGLIVMLGFILVMQTFIYMVDRLKDVDNDKLMIFATSILVLSIAMAVITTAVGKMNAPTNAKEFAAKLVIAIVAFAAVAAMMYLMTELVNKVSDVDATAMIGFSASVLILSIAMSVIMTAIGSMKTPAKGEVKSKLGVALLALVAVAAIMFVLSETVGKVKDIDGNKIAQFGAAVFMITVAMALIALVFPVLGKMSPSAIAKASAALVAIATALGAVIDILASFAKSAIEKMSSALTTMGTALKWFDEDVKLVDEDSIKRGMNIIYELVSLAIVIMKKGDLSGQLDGFATAMSRLGAGLWLFYSESHGVSAGDALNTIKDIASMSREMKTITDVGTRARIIIADVGAAIGLYYDNIKNVDLTNTPSSDEIRQMFETLAAALPSNDTLTTVQAVSGDEKAESLTQYALGLKNIATALKTFSDETQGLEFDTIDKAIQKLQSVSNLGPTLETTFTQRFDIGGFLSFEEQVVQKKQSLESFATDVISLGSALTGFGEKIGTITNWEQIDSGIKLLEKFATLNNNLPNVGGFIELVVGQKDLSSFALKLPNLGKGLRDFATEIQGIRQLSEDDNELMSAANILYRLAETANKIPVNSGFATKYSMKDPQLFAKSMGPLGQGVVNFAKALTEMPESIDETKLNQAVTVVRNLAIAAGKIPVNSGDMTRLAMSDPDKFSESMPTLGEGVVKFAEKLVDMPGGVTSKQLKDASNTILALAIAAGQIPKGSDMSTLYNGMTYDENFATVTMPYLAQGLVAFATGLQGMPRISSSLLTNAGDVMVALSKTARNISDTSGTLAIFNMEYDKFDNTKFEEAMKSMGKGLFFFISGLRSQVNKHAEDFGDYKNTIDYIYKAASAVDMVVNAMTFFIEAQTTYDYETSGYKSDFKTLVTKSWREFFAGYVEGFGEFFDELSVLESTDPIADSTLERLDLLKEFLPALASIGPYVDDLEDFKFEPVMEKVVEGVKKLFELPNDANFDSNMIAVERVGSLLSSISNITDMLSYYIKQTEYFGEEGENVNNKIEPITSMFMDLARAYSSFVSSINNMNTNDNFSFNTTASSNEWDEAIHGVVLSRIRSISEIIQLIAPYATKVSKLNAISTIFQSIATGYGKFIETLNDPTAVPALTPENEAAFERAKTLAEIVSMLASANGTGSVDLEISPIMDMDEIQRQLNEGGSIVLNNGLKLSSEFTITTKLDTEQLAQLTPTDYSANFADVSEKLGLMKTKLDEVYTRLDKFEVVMDTGAMVGAIGPDMDKYLGFRKFLAGRGS
jgi:hypothetical protein